VGCQKTRCFNQGALPSTRDGAEEEEREWEVFGREAKEEEGYVRVGVVLAESICEREDEGLEKDASGEKVTARNL
jgi:hypothetical protein